MTCVHSKKTVWGQIASYMREKAKINTKEQKTGMNERGNHLSTGACSHIKQGHNKKKETKTTKHFCFKGRNKIMVVQRDSEQRENKLYVKFGYLIIE